MKNLIVASTSTIYGGTYLEYLEQTLIHHFNDADEIVFIPFARPSGISHDTYTKKAEIFFQKLEKKLIGLHTFKNPIEAIKNAKGIFTGGGNTFLLVKQMHDLKLMAPLRNVLLNGTPYLGTSAGSNLCGITMQNTNDMPIVYPPSFKTLGVIPFNINAHYLDASPTKHMGETRETRIKEYHTQNTVPVVGLREGSWLEVKGETIELKGNLTARIFEQGKEAREISGMVDFN
ncbi:MAG: dipeptidase PepE [Patiriisocius sp.]|uniref:dipeptidase PepE n=1 Tax=Patiriisocius sp. TaxID=2822396 RepID=UPI003EF7AC76